MKILNIGLFGLGTVGCGVLELLQENQELVQQRTGVQFKVRKAVVSNLGKSRPRITEEVALSDDPSFILDDPKIDAVLELMGGTSLAKEVILTTFKQKKILVTANKALLAEQGREIFNFAAKAQLSFGYEAAVCGAIPVIRALREGLSGDKTSEISGIINGTGNYILSAMTQKGVTFEQALAKAQELGFAEADPTFDVEGIDTAHKLILLMNIAFGGVFKVGDLYTEGITHIEPIDIQIAGEFGYVIKLLGKARQTDQGVEGRVHPTLVASGQLLAGVHGAFNAVQLTGNYAGPIVLYGQGAGAKPTASAVIADLVNQVRCAQATREIDSLLPGPAEGLVSSTVLEMGLTRSSYYLRFEVDDQTGVLAKITDILGRNKISISSMTQRSRSTNGGPVSVVFFTHEAVEAKVQQAIADISQLECIKAKARLIRVDSE